MAEVNELNKLYMSMLKSWNGIVKEDGKIVFSINGEEFPIKIDDMNLYLPLSELLDGKTFDKVFFHPACENITSKETEVFKIIRKMTSMKLLEVFRKYPIVLFSVASAKSKRNWRQDTLDMIEPIQATKRTVRDELNQLFARMHIELDENGLDNRFIHFKVQKGGGRNKSTGERVYYKTKPTFPFYSEIIKRLARSEGEPDNHTVELNNFTVSRAALKLAAHLFQCIIPAVNDPDGFEFESTTPVAARLISYLGCYGEIADQLNRIQNTFRAEFDKASVYPIDTNWMEYLENLPDLYRQVPVMDYNSHNTSEEVNQDATAGSMGNMFSVSSTNAGGAVAANNQQTIVNGQVMTGSVQVTPAGNFDMTRPPMQAGDTYLRSEIDFANNQVLHYAQNISGVQAVYRCTRNGNLLMRSDLSAPNMGMMGGNMMGMVPGMVPGMMPMMGGMYNPYGMYQPPVTAGAVGAVAPSIYQDNFGGGGSMNGPAF